MLKLTLGTLSSLATYAVNVFDLADVLQFFAREETVDVMKMQTFT